MTSASLIGLVHNAQHPPALAMTKAIVRSLDLKRGDYWTSSAGCLAAMSDRLPQTRLIIVAGGDGTILRVVRIIAQYGVPLVGINMGRVGFMAELKIDEAIAQLPEYLSAANDMRVEERMMLEVSVQRPSETAPRLTLHALNDAVVSRGGIARLLDIDAVIDSVRLTAYRADAVIVSTATGSTGYALSAGGPIMYPETKAMLIQPVAAHTGLRSGLILPDYAHIELRASNDHQAVLSVDGFTDTHLAPQDVVSIRRSPYVTRFLRRHAPATFYAALTRSLRLDPRMPHADAPAQSPLPNP